MKRFVSLLILLLLLSGCGSNNSETEPTENQGSTHTVPLTEYNLPVREYTGMATLGGNLLLYGENEMVLMSSDTKQILASTAIEDLPRPESNDLQIGKKGVACYDRSSRTLYFWDNMLQFTSFMQVQDEIMGAVQLTQGWESLYYCTAEGIKVLDMSTGMSRMLKSREGNWLGITGSFQDDTVLQCRLELEDGRVRTMMILAETGETLWESDSEDIWYGSGDLYFCNLQTGSSREWIYGWGEDQPRNFWPAEEAQIIALPQGNAVVTITAEDSGAVLDFYQLTNGKRTATLTRKTMPEIDGITWVDKCVYYIEGSKLYCWDTKLSPVNDDAVYMTHRYTPADPDEKGLEDRNIQIRILEKIYGVNIFFWDEVIQVQPNSYDFTAEYIPEDYDAGLEALETALSKFPQELVSGSASWTENGKLNIVLVRDITAVDGTAVDGLQYLLDGNVCIALDMSGAVEKTFYHTMGHILDIVMLSNTKLLYDWDKLNPSGFSYDYDYAANLKRDGSQYLEESKRYFINTFSMSYPVEDRATILEYAMQSGNGEYFESQYMQAKLQQLSKAIRKAFGLKGDGYTWEQYLN